ncbi:eCIS core domain-containing protein [Enhygromyxa salina]|uniref:eCIS core domain-containing protein n=1 Tax=Enhygromyxa salina TaxID=215803 RepID=A0A2S9XC29_9BACT|nr:DUF4157 domain-containing protein [Enhygromyxa salina]PRP90408.1 hypothetical protein ENSA7_82930 [Enhygromyxa salina]
MATFSKLPRESATSARPNKSGSRRPFQRTAASTSTTSATGVSSPDSALEREATLATNAVFGPRTTSPRPTRERPSATDASGALDLARKSARRDAESLDPPAELGELSDVNVHEGPSVDRAGAWLKAKAFSHGTDVFMTRWAGARQERQRTLHHELLHTSQETGSLIHREDHAVESVLQDAFAVLADRDAAAQEIRVIVRGLATSDISYLFWGIRVAQLNEDVSKRNLRVARQVAIDLLRERAPYDSEAAELLAPLETTDVDKDMLGAGIDSPMEVAFVEAELEDSIPVEIAMEEATAGNEVRDIEIAEKEEQRKREKSKPKSKTAISTKRSKGYTTFIVPIQGGLDLVVQFYRSPASNEGGTLRFKVKQDPRPPIETPLPTGSAFTPKVVRQSKGFLSFGFASKNNADLTVRYGARSKLERHHAINPEDPNGPLLVNEEFKRTSVDATLDFHGSSLTYSYQGRLPDEAITPPTWVFRRHGNHLPSYMSTRGKYAKRVVLVGPLLDIDPQQVGTLEGFEQGVVESGKVLGSLVVYSIPYVGPVVMLGEAIAGKSIWGDEYSTEVRVIFGLLALIPIAARASGLIVESQEAAKLASELNISKNEAQILIRGAKRFTAEDQAFLRSTSEKVKKGMALTEVEATRVATLMNRIGTVEQIIFSGANDIELIWQSFRYWGQTEGAVYGARTPVTTFWQRMKAMIGKKEGLVVFQGEAAQLFKAHAVEGPYSGMKRLLGQHKAGFGDIMFDEATRQGNTIIVTRAHIATPAEIQHAGQPTTWATARLWGRRLTLEPLAAAGLASGGVMVYMLWDWVSDTDSEEDK